MEQVDNLNEYKMRCELYSDAFTFLSDYTQKTFGDLKKIIIDIDKYKGATLEISTSRSLSFVKNILENLQDLHVMSQTIENVENYTGERW